MTACKPLLRVYCLKKKFNLLYKTFYQPSSSSPPQKKKTSLIKFDFFFSFHTIFNMIKARVTVKGRMQCGMRGGFVKKMYNVSGKKKKIVF